MKFSDDTVLLSIFQGLESDHGCALPAFVKWCDDNFYNHNVLKTKDLVTDFRQNSDKPKASIIRGEDVQVVDTYKYLGTLFDSQVRCQHRVVKEGQQRIY